METEMTPENVTPAPVGSGHLVRAFRRLAWGSRAVSAVLWWLSQRRVVAALCGHRLYTCRLSTAFDDKRGGFFNMSNAEWNERVSDPTRNFHCVTNDLHRAVEWCRRGVLEFPEGTLATIAYFDLRCGGPDGTRASHVWRNASGVQMSEGLEERLGLPITPRQPQILERDDLLP